MSHKKGNIILFCLLLLVVASAWFFRREYILRNKEFLPGMLYSVPFESQSANPNFRDKKTLQLPAEHTIARGFLPVHFQATPEDAIRAGEELINPFSETEKGLTRGAFVFSTFCTPCHGNSATGDGSVTKKGFPPPPSLFADKALKMKDGQMFHILTYGQANMPSLASQISFDDRWKVILHVRSLQKQQQTVAGVKQ
ncbi:MAG: cytochrome c [Ignavibacteria bacterium]|nr:cytochrome c [Ignavibacteria bacterium]